jgi:DNA-binding response OmpR family regulator
VDDEPEIRELLKTVLEERYEVFLGSNGSEGLKLALERHPDVVVLDIMMPVMDGIATCQALRGQVGTRDIPVIMLTALKDSADKIKAFKAGADDYVAKPFYPEELMARIESKLRRASESRSATDSPLVAGAKVVVCGNLSLDTESMEVKIDGKEVVLTMLEFNLLKYFIESKGKLRSREQILEAVWNSTTVSGRILDPHVLALRKKTEGFDHALCTVYGGGYILKPIQK